MTDRYLQIMIESLEKKTEVLNRIMELNTRQAELSSHQPMDMEAYDKTMDEKGDLIEALNHLDDGFNSTYERIKDEVQGHPEKYREKVLQMQELIRQAVEKGVAIEVQEKRNRSALENVFRMKRNELKQFKTSRTAAMKYYTSMNRINHIDPQLMDKKK